MWIELTIERHNRTRASCQVCVQFCFVRRLLVLLPNFVVVVEHNKFWGNHSFWPSNITDIDRDGWNITCRWCQDSYTFPRENIFPHCCALRENRIPWENLTLLAVHRNVIFHDCPGQYLYNIPITRQYNITRLTSQPALQACRRVPGPSSVGPRWCPACGGACRVRGCPCTGPGCACWSVAEVHRKQSPA